MHMQLQFLTEWDEFTTYDWQKIYDSMQNLLFFLTEEIY